MATSTDTPPPTDSALSTDASTETPLPTGTELELRRGDHCAVITEVGAHLRAFRVDRRDVVVPFAAGELPPAFHGAVLAPWPNRIGDGNYTWEGTDYQLDLSEPERSTAIHGLVTWQRWRIVEAGPASATLTIEPPATPGYPFQLAITIGYSLGAGGLEIELRARNIGRQAAPYGVGFHPWLSPGPGALDEATLQMDATGWVRTDERLLPTGTEDLPEEFDFRSARPLGATALDDAFTGATYDDQDLSWVRLRGTDGYTAAVWMDRALGVWQLCTGDAIPGLAGRSGLAAEPMSCAADAFRTGQDLVRLEPGDDHVARWGLTLQRPTT